MAVKNPQFQSSTLNSAFVPTNAYYTSYQHLHANFTATALAGYEGWTNFGRTDLSADNVVALQMQHLRFPTPPITPPYTNNEYNSYKLAVAAVSAATTASNESIASPRNRAHAKDIGHTKSVIMKIGQSEVNSSSGDGMPPTPEHFDDMAVDIVGLDDVSNDAADALRHETVTIRSATSSASSSPKRSDYTCEWIDCGRDHNTLEALAAHVTKIHAVASSIDGLYYCRWHRCARTRGFSARYKMLVHARTHTKEKPHQCHLCTKSFSRAENLKIHIRSHSGEKPYLCTYKGCLKAYSNSSDRFKHTRTHAMDKPYMCKVPGCQKRYTDPSSLRKHVKTFKHATQLIATAAITPSENATINSGVGIDARNAVATTQQATSPLQTAHQQSSVLVPTHLTHYGNHHLHDDAYAAKVYNNATIPAICQLCVPPPLPPHYYLSAAMEEDLCSSIKAAQLDYYYATTVGHSPAPSTPTTSSSCNSNVQSDLTAGVGMELDTPLDLRVNRS